MTYDDAEIRDSRIFGIGAKTTCSEWAYFPVQNIVSWLLILVVILYHICTTNTLNKRVNINILESYPKVDKFCSVTFLNNQIGISVFSSMNGKPPATENLCTGTLPLKISLRTCACTTLSSE